MNTFHFDHPIPGSVPRRLLDDASEFLGNQCTAQHYLAFAILVVVANWEEERFSMQALHEHMGLTNGKCFKEAFRVLEETGYVVEENDVYRFVW